MRPTGVRFGVLGFACVLSTITYLDRVCFGTVASNIQAEFGLSESQKGWLFTAFAFAYSVFEVPSGWLGDRFGARRTLIRIVLWWSAFTVLTGLIFPSMANAFLLLLIVRFLFGMGEAGAYPNIARAFHNWFPFEERGLAKGAVWMAGRFGGGITAVLVYALMYESVADSGARVVHWRHIFYVFGVLGIVWCGFWWMWYCDDPAKKAGVNQAEIDLIQKDQQHQHTGKLVVPWRTLISSKNLWLLCLLYFCGAYGWYLNITYFTGYLKDPLGIERGTEKWTAQFWIAGLMAGLPLLAGSVSCLIGGMLSDWYIQRTGNRKWGRRLFGVIGHALCACCYFIALFYMKSPWTFVLLVALAAFWNDFTMGPTWASCLDIGQRYSGIVAGFMNTIGNLGGAVAGFLTGMIIDWQTRPLTSGLDRAAFGVLGQATYEQAKTDGWTINVSLYASAYVVAVVCWLWFDSTKPVVPDNETVSRAV
jgi:MFS family permease